MPGKMAGKNNKNSMPVNSADEMEISEESGAQAPFIILETGCHELLNPFYAKNGLEIAEDEPVSTDTVKSWVIMGNAGEAGAQTCDASTASEDSAKGTGAAAVGSSASKDPLEDSSAAENIAGACTLAFRQGEYIIDGIALALELRGTGGGTALLRTAEAEAAARGGTRIYLVARAPEFFRANGYVTVERGDAPEFFECFGCDQYNKSCFPEVMKHVL